MEDNVSKLLFGFKFPFSQVSGEQFSCNEGWAFSRAAMMLSSPKEIDALPLLYAVLNETLRRWNSVPGRQPRVSPFPSCTLAGVENIPCGTVVSCSAYMLHRNEDVFPEPEMWRPDRWLDSTAEELVEMRHWFWAFGSGGRMCIGSNIAIQSLKYAIAGIYTNLTTEMDANPPGMEQAEGFVAGPVGAKLLVRFHHV